ncbi:hypothetical protein ACIQBJ_08625 [Kitasatospora sp. NPDC088391]|uniref:hypothetical protein n=1 Tax=Kitasatospora sp. NPDC088391 TaxID=3364074 RepID=UPI0038059128
MAKLTPVLRAAVEDGGVQEVLSAVIPYLEHPMGGALNWTGQWSDFSVSSLRVSLPALG